MRFDVPVDPDPDEARRWLEEELGSGGGEPVTFQPPQWWTDFLEWLDELLSRGTGQQQAPLADAGQTVGVVLAVVVLAGLLVAAFVIFGLPRLRRRSRITGDLFGEDDDRPASSIRTAAQQAAAAGDFTTAVVELFRSLARDLAERGVVLTFPGTTAQDFARRTASVFPVHAESFRTAAGVFDDLRYLGGTGTADHWRSLSQLDAAVRRARPTKDTRAADAFDSSDQTVGA